MKTAKKPSPPPPPDGAQAQQITWDQEQAESFVQRLARLRAATMAARRAQKEAREAYRLARRRREESLSNLLAFTYERMLPEALPRVLDLRQEVATRESLVLESRQELTLARARREKAVAEMLACIDAWKEPLPLFERAPEPKG